MKNQLGDARDDDPTYTSEAMLDKVVAWSDSTTPTIEALPDALDDLIHDLTFGPDAPKWFRC